MTRDGTRALWLCGMLHAFTHSYHVALVPLYLLIADDLGLRDVGAASFLVTAMGFAYFIPSYWIGSLADRVSRTHLLGLGLALNGLGFVLLALSPNYLWALFSVGVAGFGGSFYHPAATALIARLFPIGTGRALGYVGVGASIGFFISPLYCGWRAMQAGSWRYPVLELGVAGMIIAALFAWLARERGIPVSVSHSTRPVEPIFRRPVLWLFFIAAGIAFSLRDFAGSGVASLSSLFLQKGHGFSPKLAGLALSCIFLSSVVSNPLFGGLSDRGRLRWAAAVLVLAAVLVWALPQLPAASILPALAIYGFFFMASYPMIEAALMESVHDSVRGRVFGIFITIAGLIGNAAHALAGRWVDALGATSGTVGAYIPIYRVLALLIVLSLLGLPCLYALRKRESVAPGSSPVSAKQDPTGVIRVPSQMP